MKFYFKKYVYQWVMTGLVGKDGMWFLGYSKRPTLLTVSELANMIESYGCKVSIVENKSIETPEVKIITESKEVEG